LSRIVCSLQVVTRKRKKNVDMVEKTKENEEEYERIIGVAIIKFDNRLDHSQN
jgi:hypothetical protein